MKIIAIKDGVERVVMVSSDKAALEICLRSLSMEPGDTIYKLVPTKRRVKK